MFSLERKKSLGQCFLHDKNILILEAKLGNCSDKNVLEIGPGDGRLTEAILSQNPKHLTIVEKDSRFAALLREKFANQNVTVIEGDFLEFPSNRFDVVFGNIPYYISSDIIFRLKDFDFDLAILIVQKEFAQKMAQKPNTGNYGRLSVTSQLFFDVKLERTISRNLFRPSPRVDSALITLKPTKFKSSVFLENIIRYLFSHKNKTVRNALLDSKQFSKEQLECLDELASRRAKTLSKEECIKVAQTLQSSKV